MRFVGRKKELALLGGLLRRFAPRDDGSYNTR